MFPFINIHTHRLQPQAAIQVLALSAAEWKHGAVPDKQPVSVGIHPAQSNDSTLAQQLAWVEEALEQPNLLALGEIGLDRCIDTPLAIQLNALNVQLELAKKYSKPVVFHSVRTTSDILHVCKQQRLGLPFIVHGFAGTPEEVQQLQHAGGYLSVGARLLAKPCRDKALKQAYRLNALFFETDEATISIADVYRQAAAVLQVNVEQLKQDVCRYFYHVFGKEKILQLYGKYE